VDRDEFRQALGGDDADGRHGGAAQGLQLIEVRRRGDLVRRQEAGRHQGIVQLVGVARIGTRLFAHARDRVRVERAEVVRRRGAATRLHRVAPPLFQAAHRPGRCKAWSRESRRPAPTVRECPWR
jgi:hypothetical protein